MSKTNKKAAPTSKSRPIGRRQVRPTPQALFFIINPLSEKTVNEELPDQRVYISGFKHSHELVVGVAYYYRGHYLYACPKGNPIDPVAFSTKKGIRIAGIAKYHAPKFDPNDTSLVHEGYVRALERSCFHERQSKREAGEEMKPEAVQGRTYTPHNHSQYLAYSAPGSRVGSIDNLCHHSFLAPPSDSLSVAGQRRTKDTRMRTVASTSQLHQLLTEEETHSRDGLSESTVQQDQETLGIEIPSTEAWMDLDSISAFVEAVSYPPSHPPSSRPLSRLHNPDVHSTTLDQNPNYKPHLPGLGHPHTTPQEDLPSPTLYIPLSTKGRPRAASRALNEAYNAASVSRTAKTPPSNTTSTPRCPLHDEPCDGETVTEPHITVRAQGSSDFVVQGVPLIRCADGRMMVDWMALRDEEMERLGAYKE